MWNEMIKHFFRLGTYLCIAFLILIASLGFIINLFMGVDESMTKSYDGNNWEQTAKSTIEDYSKDIAKIQEDPKANEDFDKIMELTAKEEEISRLQYHLDEDIQPAPQMNQYEQIYTNTKSLFTFAVFLIVIITSSMIAVEHHKGTIKMLLTRPVSRVKIILSKYLTAAVIGFILLAILYAVVAIWSLITMPGNPTDLLVVKSPDGYDHANFLAVIGKSFLANLFTIIMISWFTVSFSAIFKSTPLALGISFITLYLAPLAMMWLSSKIDEKYLKFWLGDNWFIQSYIGGFETPKYDGMTLTFSIIITLLYIIPLMAIAIYMFRMRDVTSE